MLDYIEKIVYLNDAVEIHGSVPVKLKAYEDQDQSAETAKIEFCIKDCIPKIDKMGRKNRQPDYTKPITLIEFERMKEAKNK